MTATYDHPSAGTGRHRPARAGYCCRAWLIALVSLLAIAASTPSRAATAMPRFEVVDGGWGSGLTGEIRTVLEAVAGEFPLPAAAGPALAIRVRHRYGGPQISYDRDADGWLQVHLSARDDRWYQYIYQFAHEYCHLLARFDRKQDGADIVRDHQWFEESLCETASLFALSRLAVAWQAPDQPAMFREAAPLLTRYLNQLKRLPHRRLEPGTDFASWYAHYQNVLIDEPYLRQHNELVAMHLLPLFEKTPQGWRALAFLYATPPAAGQDFADFLGVWHAAAPPDARPLIAQIRGLFGLPKRPEARSASAPIRSRLTPRPDIATESGS